MEVIDKWIRNKSDEAAAEQGYYFDDKKGEYLCNFFETFIQIPDGRFAGEKCKLLDWQRDLLMRLNGWRRPSGSRRYNKAFIAIPKKNAKSFLCSGLATFFGLADGEPSPEIIIGAGAKEQAEIVFNSARKMIKASKALLKQCNIVDSRKKIELPNVEGVIRVISSDADRQEGINSNLQILDEIHSHKNRDLFDCLLYAGEARRQSLFITITTAGANKEHFSYEEWQYAQKVIDGNIIDIGLLPIIYSIGNGDINEIDLDDIETWRKANPSLGTVLLEEDFIQKMATAKESPIKWNAWLRYRGNRWVDSVKAWLNMEKWKSCPDDVDKDDLLGKVCYGGLDLSHSKDLTTFVLWFPDYEALLCWAWTPSAQVRARTQKNKASFLRFIEREELTVIDGEDIDQTVIEEKIKELKNVYQIQAVGYDPWSAKQLALNLEAEGVDMASFRQGFGSMSEPTKNFDRMVLNKNIRHFGNELLAWCASNCTVAEDASGNIKPDKEKSHEMIDPIVASIMAIALAGLTPQKPVSVYETRGIRHL